MNNTAHRATWTTVVDKASPTVSTLEGWLEIFCGMALDLNFS